MLAARPEVFNHNIETVRRLHRRMRGAKASYDEALWLLRRAKELADYPVLTKSGIIVGLGETNDEVVETMRDLRAHGVDVVTIGQYLQPSAKHASIDRWVHPDEFRWLREQGEALGFGSVFAGPLVRSSLPRRRAAPCRRRPAAAPSPTANPGIQHEVQAGDAADRDVHRERLEHLPARLHERAHAVDTGLQRHAVSAVSAAHDARAVTAAPGEHERHARRRRRAGTADDADRRDRAFADDAADALRGPAPEPTRSHRRACGPPPRWSRAWRIVPETRGRRSGPPVRCCAAGG